MKHVFHSFLQALRFSGMVVALAMAESASGQDGSVIPEVGENLPPEVRLAAPVNGAQFVAPAEIRLTAQASDRDGWVRTVEFFANDRSLGVTTNNPLSASAINPFQLAWTNVAAGEYALRAKAVDDKGATATSAIVKIIVLAAPPQAAVNVAAVKAEASESGDARSRTLSFRFARSGSRDLDLPVFYSVKGTATMGEDFPKLTGTLTIPKGAEAAELSFQVNDDTATESEETVLIRVEPPVCIQIFPPPPECYRVGERAEARGIIAASDQAPREILPTVTIVATMPETREPAPEIRVQPGRALVSRTGDARSPLLVWLRIGGTAETDKDYETIRSSVLLETGVTSKEILIGARSDEVAEGDETVVIEVVPVPPTVDTPYSTRYAIHAERHIARVVIHDTDRATSHSTLQIHAPKEGTEFRATASIRIEVTAIDPLGDIRLVEFFANGRLIGKSEHLTKDAVIPGKPRQHVFEWTGVAAGRYEVIAKAKDTAGAEILSQAVRFTVIAGAAIPVVTIEAAVGETGEPSTEALVRPGRFVISRRGGSDATMPVFFEIGGTARNGEDYRKMERWVIIPGNTNSVVVEIVTIDDALAEGDETVEVKLTHRAPDDFPLDLAVLPYAIAPDRAAARVVIRDNDRPASSARIEITAPKNGQQFVAPASIEIAATAIDPQGYISRLEFYAGDRRIGVSELTFIRAPDPGTPIHHTFEWKLPPAGAHHLTARGVNSLGTKVNSSPVTIAVERAAEPSGNQPPGTTIIHPAAGAELPAGEPIEIVVQARDGDGYVPKVEFFDGDRKLGEQNIAFIIPPPPGETQTFRFVWREPTLGAHVLKARATDDRGLAGSSRGVEVKIVGNSLPVVSVSTRDAFAVEPTGAATEVNTAAFLVRRVGTTNEALTVHYTLHGTAENGIDYEKLSGAIVIPAGLTSTSLVVRPLSDSVAERVETVILQLESRPQYRLRDSKRAPAIIRDAFFVRAGSHSNAAESSVLADGSVHLSLAAQAGAAMRVEVSSDLLNWETVSETSASDEGVHIVDETAGAKLRFYRVVPEATSP